MVGFESEKLYLMPLSKSSGLRAGAKVYVSEERDSALVCPDFLGRVVNAHGDPIDGKEVLGIGQKRSLVSNPINPMDRTPINEVLDVGIRSINALFTIGCGQRIGLIAGSGVGKSVLLGMMTRFSRADVIVIGLIGERGREVKAFIEESNFLLIEALAEETLKIILDEFDVKSVKGRFSKPGAVTGSKEVGVIIERKK